MSAGYGESSLLFSPALREIAVETVGPLDRKGMRPPVLSARRRRASAMCRAFWTAIAMHVGKRRTSRIYTPPLRSRTRAQSVGSPRHHAELLLRGSKRPAAPTPSLVIPRGSTEQQPKRRSSAISGRPSPGLGQRPRGDLGTPSARSPYRRKHCRCGISCGSASVGGHGARTLLRTSLSRERTTRPGRPGAVPEKYRITGSPLRRPPRTRRGTRTGRTYSSTPPSAQLDLG